MINIRDIYYCDICKNVIEVFEAGKPALVCCGQKMEKLTENTVDAAVEKHVPVIETTAGGIKVKVGEDPHPMTEEHSIRFIEVQTKNMVLKAELEAGMLPEAEFPVKAEDVVLVREYCNLHGLWKDRKGK